MVYKGIDVSSHNGKIDFSKVKKAGIDFVLIRAGYGKNTIDKTAEYNITNALSNNIDVGIYWFSYAGNVTEARGEAVACYNFIKKWNGKIRYPIFFDWEYDSFNYQKEKGNVCNKSTVSEMAIAFCSEIEKNGYYAGVYTNIDYYNNFFNDSVKEKYGVWIAKWSSTKPNISNFDIWQYGGEQNYIDSKYVDGISGIVDKNVTYKNFPAIMEKNSLNYITTIYAQTDINKDGKTDSYDALKILQEVVKNE
jgi:GH25 family lysozyme M1 (1,4-beta-N-acetylmuramidase)